MKNCNGEQIVENAMIYGENIKIYNDYLNFIAYLIKAMSLPANALSESITLKKLTDQGFFCKDKTFNIKCGIDNDIVGFWGMHVINGIASCRHIANFQTDVISRNCLISEPFYCYITGNNFKNMGNFTINHAINLIKYKDVYYGYDATNNKLFQFIDGIKMRELFSDNPFYAYYKPEIKLSQNGKEIACIEYDIDLFNSMESKETISANEYSYINNYAERQIIANQDLLDSFHESSKKYIKKITNKIK